jgi:adenylate kinase
MKIIAIGGTPCTGKTTIAQKLGEALGREVINLGVVAIESGCITEEDLERDTTVIDEDCLVEALMDLIHEREDDLIIEGHYVDLVPWSSLDFAVVLRTHPDILRERLKSRGYSEPKVAENVEAEVFGACQLDALDAFGEEFVFEIDTSKVSVEEAVKMIVGLLDSDELGERIDWMIILEENGTLDDYIKR